MYNTETDNNNHYDDNFEVQQSFPPVSTEYRQTGNRRYDKTPRYGRNGEQRTHYHDSGNAIEPTRIQAQPNIQQNMPQQFSTTNQQSATNFQQQHNVPQLQQQPTMIYFICKLPPITNSYVLSVQPQPVIGNVTTQQQQQDYSSGFIANNCPLQPQGGVQNSVQNT
ncbi:unnamed protein product [Mytilus coruscus]|uniref:Uncharacterized protein n=1 Tax=Mytilus coruscus TaxID=42192 RepID=A0A6J8BIM4_MYTCO|nr:unnamed protein product [Mytilus coruscus]